MTPARAWDVVVDGSKHVVVFAPGISTQRPNQLAVDGFPTSIAWHRTSGRAFPWREDKSNYEATLDIAGQSALITWRPVHRERSFDANVVALLIQLVAGLTGSNPGVIGGEQGGEVALLIRGRVVPFRNARRTSSSRPRS